MNLFSITRSAHWVLSKSPAVKAKQILEASQHWSREKMDEYRDDKLRRLIHHAYNNVAYYRRVMDSLNLQPRDIQGADDLGKFPILNRDALRAHSKELLATNVGQMSVIWCKTGGTTGEPIQICKDQNCVAWESMCYERGLEWAGLRYDAPRIRLFGGSLGITQTKITGQIGARFRGDIFLPAFELRSDTANVYFERIRKSKSRFLIGYSSAIYKLATFAKEMKQEIMLDTVFPTAETILPEWEEVIRETFKCKIRPYYGCGEVNSLGYQFPGESGYRIPEEHAIIEAIQGGQTDCQMSEGRFLITDLDNYAMPMIRYANGDAGKISDFHNGKASFGYIERLDGRYTGFLLTDAGDLISGAIAPHIFRNVKSVKNYQIIQEEPLSLLIKVVPKIELHKEELQLVIDLFINHLGSKMKVRVEEVKNIPVPPSGKSVFVFNHCL